MEKRISTQAKIYAKAAFKMKGSGRVSPTNITGDFDRDRRAGVCQGAGRTVEAISKLKKKYR